MRPAGLGDGKQAEAADEAGAGEAPCADRMEPRGLDATVARPGGAAAVTGAVVAEAAGDGQPQQREERRDDNDAAADDGALGGSGGCRRESLPSPIRNSTAEIAESGIGTHSAISAAVIRNRRNTAIASTSCSLVLLGTDRGAEERSRNPASPSAR